MTKRRSRKSHLRRRSTRRRHVSKSYRRKYSSHRRRSSKRHRKSFHGGDFEPRPPSLAPMGPYYERKNIKKPLVPPISSPTGSFESQYIPEWRTRRNTFVEMQDRKNRERSGTFAYPSRESRYSPWEKVKYAFVKDKRPYPPVFQ